MARDYGWLVSVLGATVELQRIRTCKVAYVCSEYTTPSYTGYINPWYRD